MTTGLMFQQYFNRATQGRSVVDGLNLSAPFHVPEAMQTHTSRIRLCTALRIRSVSTHFSPAAIKFLRGLERNNDREWFDARKPVYERALKAPMLAIVDEVNQALGAFAPEFVRPPQKCVMRIYRDIRFSKDKKPYKTNVAAWWARHGLEKTSGGGFYFDMSPSGVRIAAGCYMPEKDQLLAIRRMLLDRHEEYRAIVGSRRMKASMPEFDGLKMTRGPKGFSLDHPAADLVLQRQWGVGSTLPAETALGPSIVKEIVQRFKLAAPLVALLNDPLLGKPKKPLF
jgi:uncharacterized protein (TIGR02453 family)